MFEQGFFRLFELFSAFVFSKTVPPARYAGRLYRKNEVVVVLPVEKGHEPLFAGETLIDQEVFLVVPHRVPEIDIDDRPTVPLEFVANHPVKVLVVDGIVGSESRGIVVINDGLIFVSRIVCAEVVDKSRDFPLEFDEERFYDVEPTPGGLPGDYPVDIGVVVHADTNRLERIDVFIGPTVEQSGVEVVAERIEIIEIAGVVFMGFAHGGVEPVFGDTYPLAEDRGPECFRRQVALHLLDVVLAQKLKVLDRGVLFVIHGDRPHFIEVRIETTEIALQVLGDWSPFFFTLPYPSFCSPNFEDRGFDGVDEFDVHLLLVMKEPRALLRLGHIAQNHERMVERAGAEIRFYAAVGGERFFFELFVVDELGFVDEHPRER